MCVCLYLTTSMKKEGMNLKNTDEGTMGGFEESKEKKK